MQSGLTVELSPNIRMEGRTIGAENTPLLVIDNFVKEPDELIKWAVTKNFVPADRFFPGIRAKAPLSYQRFVLDQLHAVLREFFRLEDKPMGFTMCRYSLVTTPGEQLVLEQRIPHVDSMDGNRLATIHYLFRQEHGGTAFYRHRRTGFEYIDRNRQQAYAASLEAEVQGPQRPPPGYINGDTPLFEQVERQDGVFNRILVYRGNSLHSGSIDGRFVPDPNPLTGRLSINSFIDTGP
ncbi:MAG: DUF6445 family protein [Woeseiaceae bacterium]